MGATRIRAGAAIFAAAVTCAAATLESPYRHYSLKLNSLFTPQAHTTGLFLKGRIDGGPQLRLLLDSGAQYIVLNKRAAAASKLTAGSSMELVGLGTSSKTARRVSAGRVEIGDLAMRECDMVAVDTPILDGAACVIPPISNGRFGRKTGLPVNDFSATSWRDAGAAGGVRLQSLIYHYR